MFNKVHCYMLNYAVCTPLSLIGFKLGSFYEISLLQQFVKIVVSFRFYSKPKYEILFAKVFHSALLS